MSRDPSKKHKVFILGGGAHTIPSYRALLKKLSIAYTLTLYSEFNLGSKYVVDEYKIRSVPKFKIPSRIREVWFGMMVLWDTLFNKPDLIHSHSTFPSGLVGVIISKLFRIPLLVSLDAAEASGVKSIGFGDLLHNKRMRFNRYVLNHASAITVLTKFQLREVIKNLELKKVIKVIPRGVDINRFPFIETKRTDKIRLLNVGYIHPVKDHTTLLNCVKILQSKIGCSLVQVGQDYSDGTIEKLSESYHLTDVVFVGFVPHEKIQQFYEQADILIHTSVFESQAMVVAEALASGVLVCGTHVGLMADLENECCVTVPPGDARELADKILELINDPDRINQLKRKGRKWAEKYDLNWTANQYQELYQSLIS